MSDFIIAALTPITTQHAGLAIAAARAGGAALLDAELWSPETSALADANLRSVMRDAPADASVGLRVRYTRLDALRPLLSTVSARRHRLVVAGWNARIEDVLAALPPAEE